MTDNERLFLLSVLGDNPEEADFQKAAYLLTVKRTEDEVHGLWKREMASRARVEAAQALRFIAVWEPQPGDKVVKGMDGDMVHTKPPIVRHILLSELSEYCKLHKLDPDKLLAVGMGEIAEYRGYTQAPFGPGQFGRVGQSYAEKIRREELAKNGVAPSEPLVTTVRRSSAAIDDTPKPWKKEAPKPKAPEKKKGGWLNMGVIE